MSLKVQDPFESRTFIIKHLYIPARVLVIKTIITCSYAVVAALTP